MITEDICDKNKIKNDVNNTTNNNQNLDNDDERVRRNAINVENQVEWKVEDESKQRKNTALIVGDSMISGIDQQCLSV